MKIIIRTCICAISLTIPFTINAGEVTDTFTAGDTLTATKMNSIKTAVNDNDSRITINDGQITTNQSDIMDNKSVVAIDRTSYGSGDTAYLTQTVSTATSVSLNAPSAGKVIVSYSGEYSITHTSGTGDMFCIQMTPIPTVNPSPGCDGGIQLIVNKDTSHRYVAIPSTDPSRSFPGRIHTQQVFTVSGAGNHTYYLRGQSNSTGSNIYLGQGNMIAYFVAD